jgi:hypothetical protein
MYKLLFSTLLFIPLSLTVAFAHFMLLVVLGGDFDAYSKQNCHCPAWAMAVFEFVVSPLTGQRTANSWMGC